MGVNVSWNVDGMDLGRNHMLTRTRSVTASFVSFGSKSFVVTSMALFIADTALCPVCVTLLLLSSLGSCEKSNMQSIYQSYNQSNSQSYNQSYNQFYNQSNNHLINHIINSRINQIINHLINHIVNHIINQIINHLINHITIVYDEHAYYIKIQKLLLWKSLESSDAELRKLEYWVQKPSLKKVHSNISNFYNR